MYQARGRETIELPVSVVDFCRMELKRRRRINALSWCLIVSSSSVYEANDRIKRLQNVLYERMHERREREFERQYMNDSPPTAPVPSALLVLDAKKWEWMEFELHWRRILTHDMARVVSTAVQFEEAGKPLDYRREVWRLYEGFAQHLAEAAFKSVDELRRDRVASRVR